MSCKIRWSLVGLGFDDASHPAATALDSDQMHADEISRDNERAPCIEIAGKFASNRSEIECSQSN